MNDDDWVSKQRLTKVYKMGGWKCTPYLIDLKIEPGASCPS